MRSIFIAVCALILPLISLAQYCKALDEVIPVYSLRHEFRDTIDFRDRMTRDDRKLIIYCAAWCRPSYKEFNKLYSQGIIDSLKESEFFLKK